MPNKFVLIAENVIAITCWDKSYEFRKIEKLGKNNVPTCPFLQAWSHDQMCNVPVLAHQVLRIKHAQFCVNYINRIYAYKQYEII